MNRDDVRAEISKKGGDEVKYGAQGSTPTLMSLGPQRTATRWRLTSRQARKYRFRCSGPISGQL